MDSIEKQNKYLPTPEELSLMNQGQFHHWIEDAYIDLPKRERQRDPLFHLKKRIIDVLEQDLPEAEKERLVYLSIEKYFKPAQ